MSSSVRTIAGSDASQMFFTVARKGVARFYDFSGVSGLDFADDTRAFAVTDIDGDGNLDFVLKSRLARRFA